MMDAKPEYNEAELNAAIEKGSKAWADVPSIPAFVAECRGADTKLNALVALWRECARGERLYAERSYCKGATEGKKAIAKSFVFDNCANELEEALGDERG